MRPVVLTAVLMLVRVQDTMTAVHPPGRELFLCRQYPDRPCGDGWSRLDDDRCVKYFKTPKTFSEAEEHCRTLNAGLVTMHKRDDMYNLVCLNWRATREIQTVWIGVVRSGNKFTYTDGSELDYSVWAWGEQNNAAGQEDCVEMIKSFEWVWWHDVRCSKKNFFACAKKM